MRRQASAVVLGVALAMSHALAGCSSCNDNALKTGDAGTTIGSLTPEQAAKVLAKVGDKTITLGDYAAALEHMDQFDRMRYQSPERRKELLQEMINVTLLAQEARAKGYDKDPIAQQEMRSILRDAMLAQARKGAPTPNDIPDDEVHAFFDAHKADYKDPERRRVSAIVLADAPSANDVLAAAKSASASQWGDLVRKKSIDPQARANVPVDLAGDLGMISPPGDPRGDNPKVPPEVRAAAFEIPSVGAVLGRVVRSGSKFYVVRLVQKSDPHERTYAEAERTIRVKLAQDKIRAREDALLDQLKKQYPVQIDETALSNVQLVPQQDAGAADATRE
jgi:DNA-directed RNA polymerase subunit F